MTSTLTDTIVLDLGELERDAMLAWVGEHLALARRSASGQRVFYWILATGFVRGLAAHVGGFLLKFSATAEPVLLAADLLYAQRRQYKRALDAYEAAMQGQAEVGTAQVTDLASAEDG